MSTYCKIMAKSLFVYSWVYSFEVNRSIGTVFIFSKFINPRNSLLQWHNEVILYIDKTNVSICQKVSTLSSGEILKDFPTCKKALPHALPYMCYDRFILNSTGTEVVTTHYHHIVKKKVLISFNNI